MSSRDVNATPFTLQGFVWLWLLLVVVWLAVSSAFAVESVLPGALISAALAAFFARRFDIWGGIRVSPGRVYHFLLYTGVFLRELVHANIAMMRYVYAPRIEIEPGIVTVKTRLKSPIARLALANSISLTPGSLVLDLEGDEMLVHCLDMRGADPNEVARGLTRGIEEPLEKTFG